MALWSYNPKVDAYKTGRGRGESETEGWGGGAAHLAVLAHYAQSPRFELQHIDQMVCACNFASQGGRG